MDSEGRFIYLKAVSLDKCKSDKKLFMRILLIRHFKVDFRWEKDYNHMEYIEALKNYNNSPVINVRELDFPIEKVYTSSLSRTRETAKYFKGNKTIISTSLIDEIDLQGSSFIYFRLPVRMCHRFALLKSILNRRTQNETRKETNERANKFLDMIEDKNEDCIVVSHVMFLKVLMKIMEKRGYKALQEIKPLNNGEVAEYIK